MREAFAKAPLSDERTHAAWEWIVQHTHGSFSSKGRALGSKHPSAQLATVAWQLADAQGLRQFGPLGRSIGVTHRELRDAARVTRPLTQKLLELGFG
jgi:hypothetical protein